MSEGALAAVREACNELTPLPDYLHDALLRYFRSYVAVGGMPEVVQRFYDGGGDFVTVYELQVELVKSYKNDISKYAGKRALDVQAIFDQLPLQLDSDSRLNVERDGKVVYLPWYASFCLPQFTQPKVTPLVADLPRI